MNKTYEAPKGTNPTEIGTEGSLNAEEASEATSSMGQKIGDAFSNLIQKAKDATQNIKEGIMNKFKMKDSTSADDTAEGAEGAGEEAGEEAGEAGAEAAADTTAEAVAGGLQLADAAPIIGEVAMLVGGLITAGVGISDAVQSSNIAGTAADAGKKALAGVKNVVPQFGGHYVMPTNDSLHNIGDHFSGF